MTRLSKSQISKMLGMLMGVCLTWSNSSMAMPAAEMVDALNQQVLRVNVKHNNGQAGLGSAVVIGQDQVVTNCHVVRGGGKIAIFRGPESYVVQRERIDVQRDLCLLEAPGMQAAKARLGQISSLKSGQPLYFYGYPRALGMSFSEGSGHEPGSFVIEKAFVER